MLAERIPLSRIRTTNKPVAIVFGVGAELGVGADVCRRFAREGHCVLVAGRTTEKIEQVVCSIEASGGRAEALTTDVTREADVFAAFDRGPSLAGECKRSAAFDGPLDGPVGRLAKTDEIP